MNRVSIKGVVLGGIIDIVATNIAALPVVILAGLRASVHTLPKDQQTRTVIETLQNTPSLYLTQMVVGGLCSILGGYVAARIAKRGAILNGALSAFLCVASGVYPFVTKADSLSPWAHAGFFLLSPALGALGGYLWEWRQATKKQITPAAA